MPKRKPVEATEAVPAVTNAKTNVVAPSATPVAEPKKTVRKAAEKPKSVATGAAHKHHAKKNADPVMEVPVASAPVQITHEAISRLAYSYWEARGYQSGSSESDWLRAEQELLKLS